MHIMQSRKMATKFMDPSPSNKVVFGTSGTGPTTKNLARLNDPVTELRRKVTMGRTSSVLQFLAGSPVTVRGKKLEVNMTRAKHMCVYKKLKYISGKMEIRI